MQRARRIFINVATVLSLLLLLGTIGLWVRSYWRHDMRLSKFGNVQRSAESLRGTLQFCGVWSAFRFSAEDEGVHWYAQPVFPTDTLDGRYNLRARQWHFLGFANIEGDHREGAIYPGEPPMPYRVAVIPIWFVAVLFGLLPVIWAGRGRVRRRRLRRGLCAGCGYDLRASPERCPECGMVRTTG